MTNMEMTAELSKIYTAMRGIAAALRILNERLVYLESRPIPLVELARAQPGRPFADTIPHLK